jgi:ribosomal protein S18 acetylase RimI-like enzyme
MPPTLRACRPDDQDFLFKLYSSTREQEFAGLGWPAAQLETFMRMQFNAQQRWYETMYAQAEHQIVEQDGGPIGRLMVLRDKDFTQLVDIALLTEHRGQGIGGALLCELIQQCTRDRLTLRLQVLKINPAQRLYERLGFKRVSEDQMYFQMERKP